MYSKIYNPVQIIIILLMIMRTGYLFNQDAYLLSKNSSKNDSDKIALNNIVTVDKDITIAKYFNYIDSLVIRYDTLTLFNLSEHLLVRSNPWIIDTLKKTDYYHMMALDSFVYDQKKMIVLKKGSKLIIPDSMEVYQLVNAFQKTKIDINIPEFKLRIFEDSIELYEFPIRVGRNEKKYLKMGDRITDLKTKTGSGQIVNHVRDPKYYNPVNGKQYHVTKRDDHKTTALPQIPFLETEIDGIRYGQLIHPTTNPETLGQPYSNGCIGTKEGDAWIIYYYAPIGTKVNIRYDLEIENGQGEDVVLKDIYKVNNNN